MSPDEADRLRRSVPLRRLPGRNRTKSDILFFRLDETPIALKDYGARPLLVRNTIGRFLIRREAAAYRAAGALPGLPRFMGRVGAFALALEWIDARPLAELPRQAVPPACFDELERIVAALHTGGIALGDLHHRDVLIGSSGSVHVVDLATAWICGPRAGRIRRSIFERLREVDRIGVARLRARFLGGDIEAAVDVAGPGAARRYRRGRRFKRRFDRIRGRRH